MKRWRGVKDLVHEAVERTIGLVEDGHQSSARGVMRVLDGIPGRDMSYLEPEGENRFRIVEGRERGELLRVVRDGSGAVEKLYFATYPLRRTPSTF